MIAGYFPWSPYPVRVVVWYDRSQDHQQTGCGSHVQGGNHKQRRLPPGTHATYTEPVLQHLHSRDSPALRLTGK